MLSGCAHHYNVPPQANGQHYIQLKASELEAGKRELIEQANHYCESLNNHMVVLNEKGQYTGAEQEGEYKAKIKLANAAEGAGTGMWILGGGSAEDAGAILRVGGILANQIIGNQYQVSLTSVVSNH